MYQSLIWPTVLRDEARRLGTPVDAKDLQSLADSLVDEAKAVELTGAQPFDPVPDICFGYKAVRPPIAVRQAVPILPSDSRPAQHYTELPRA